MARRNIFEIANDNYNFDDEFRRIYNRFKTLDISSQRYNFTIEEFADANTIINWKARRGFNNCKELLKLLNLYDILADLGKLSFEEKMIWFEYALNLIFTFHLEQSRENYLITNQINFTEIDAMLYDIKKCIESVGYETKLFPFEQQVIIVQKNACASSVAELVDDNLARQIFEYNRFNMKGEIGEKAKILVSLGYEFEGFRSELEKINKSLASDIGLMLNGFDLRHNINVNPTKNPVSKKFILLTPDEQEKWYDKTYDLLLLAFLSIDGDKIQKEFKELKKSE